MVHELLENVVHAIGLKFKNISEKQKLSYFIISNSHDYIEIVIVSNERAKCKKFSLEKTLSVSKLCIMWQQIWSKIDSKLVLTASALNSAKPADII